MSDTRYSGGAGRPGSGKSPVQQAKDLAGDVGKQASEVAHHATARVKEQVSGMTESAKELVFDAVIRSKLQFRIRRTREPTSSAASQEPSAARPRNLMISYRWPDNTSGELLRRLIAPRRLCAGAI